MRPGRVRLWLWGKENNKSRQVGENKQANSRAESPITRAGAACIGKMASSGFICPKFICPPLIVPLRRASCCEIAQRIPRCAVPKHRRK